MKRMEYEKATLTYRRVGFRDSGIIRRHTVPKDEATVWRPAFVHDIDKILHCPYYNRYADKTQAFSFFKNDDISRRSLHVQLVSRIARTIGNALNLNLDLIEAISLGHDIGHTPFGHAGERCLNAIYHAHTGRYFNHNIQSVRVLDEIFPVNLSLQTLDGFAAHNGEIEMAKYKPVPLSDFAEFDALMERCCVDPELNRKLVPSTLEGCVMRISDIIAYLGKDRQDAENAGILANDSYDPGAIGTTNSEIINNLIVNIIECSYGRDYICMDSEHFDALQKAKRENYDLIYKSDRGKTDPVIEPMMESIYEKLLDDYLNDRRDSLIFTHHLDYILPSRRQRPVPYLDSEPNQIIVDYIASMTDDYFIDLYHKLFPDSGLKVKYVGYFDWNKPESAGRSGNSGTGQGKEGD